MKKLVVIFTVLTLSITISCKKSTSPGTPPSDVNLKKGLLVYLPFDGNIADSSGNGNLTTAYGGAVLTYDEHGYANSAFGGTGNGERVIVTNNGSIKFDTTFTLSFDIMTRTQDRRSYIAMTDYATGKSFSFGISQGVPGLPNVAFGVADTNLTCGDWGVVSNTTTDTSQYVLQPEAWYNLVAVFHKGTIQIYVNGALVATKTGASPTVPICTGSQLVIGAWWQQDPISLNGKLDEVRLYNRVLNADEITELAKDFQQ